VSFLDCHTHTAEWSDGRQSIEEVMVNAKAEGVRVGLADHAGLGDYLNSNDRLLAYADFLSQYPVARGVEMDLGRSFHILPGTRLKFDYVIGSMHGLQAGAFRMEFLPLIKYLKGQKPGFDVLQQLGNLDAFFRAHLDLLKKEFAAQKYDILGHCTMLPPLAAGKPEDHFPEWWEEELIALLLKHGVAMELSNRWKTPYDRLMEKALRAGVMFSIGSDGHDKKTTCVLEYPKDMIDRFGVKEDRIFNVERKIA
jgi:histidinol phosphatase-like PHP family hydrolase